MFITVITPCMVKKKTGSLDDVISLQTPFFIKPCTMLGLSFHSIISEGFKDLLQCQCVYGLFIFFLGSNKWDNCTHLTWKLGQWVMRDHYKHPVSLHCASCWDDVFSLDHTSGVSIGSPNISVSMVYAVLPGWSNCCNKWDHCTHLICKMDQCVKWDHYKHPLQ